MPTVPTANGSSGKCRSRVRSPRSSSHRAPRQPSTARPRKTSFWMNRLASSTAPRPRPTPMAIGRLRPAREVFTGGLSSSRGSASAGSCAGSSGSPIGNWPVLTGPVCRARSASSSAARSARRRSRRDCGGGAVPSGGGSGLGVSAGMGSSDLEKFLLLACQHRIDGLGVLLGQAVQFALCAGDLVLTGLPVLGDPVQFFLGPAADAAHRDAGFLPLGLGEFDVVPAALFGQAGQDDADDVAVVARVDAEVRFAQGFLDGVHGGFVVGADEDGTSFLDGDRGELLQGGGRTV